MIFIFFIIVGLQCLRSNVCPIVSHSHKQFVLLSLQVFFFYFRQSKRCVVVCHCFDLHFLSAIRCWSSFTCSFVISVIFFGEMLLYIVFLTFGFFFFFWVPKVHYIDWKCILYQIYVLQIFTLNILCVYLVFKFS